MTDPKELMSYYSEIESATAPIDQVITLLDMLRENFSLGSNELTTEEKEDLLRGYQQIGEMLLLSTITLERVVKDVEALAPRKVEKLA